MDASKRASSWRQTRFQHLVSPPASGWAIAWHGMACVTLGGGGGGGGCQGPREEARQQASNDDSRTDKKRFISAGTARRIAVCRSSAAVVVHQHQRRGGRDWRRETGCGRGWAQRGHGSVGWLLACLVPEEMTSGETRRDEKRDGRLGREKA
ncbi:uncharacterized protein J3D65DRAFT_624714 [Phyllosticta citribraziliensis]|uniref:Uncharacterized protein n=1 Tax=Phyllosticta citribraziliensis TaxID=989973 RepID=A0ABR1LPT5_9PEZI